MYQWLQVELPQVKKITGIVTQGAKALRKEMYVMSYSLQYSDNGIHWNHYTDDENVTFKVSCSKITWKLCLNKLEFSSEQSLSLFKSRPFLEIQTTVTM